MNVLPGEQPIKQWRPKLFECLKSYRREDLSRDLIAGLTVGLVALPLAMAFGIASGVTPQAGIYTAIVGGLIVSLFGGSKIQISGRREHLSSSWPASLRSTGYPVCWW